MADNHAHASHDNAQDHGHVHGHGGDNVGIAFFLNLTFAVIEIIGGLLTNSVAILSDAVHDLGDSLSIALAWILQRLSRRGPSARYSFGLGRYSLLGALINALILLAGSAFVLSQAIPRLLAPQLPHAPGMLGLALLGLAFNGLAVYRTSRGRTMNERVLTWHLLEDLLGWAAVLITSVALLITQWALLDPLLSILITLVILAGVIRNLRQTLFLFLQGVPSDQSLAAVEEALTADPGTASVHDLHLWSLDGARHVLTAHIRLQPTAEPAAVKDRLRRKLRTHGITHATLETEAPEEPCGGACGSPDESV